MSWTPEVYIGELRPWPESVKVVRGNSGEAMRYDRSERSEDGVERSKDGVAETCVFDDYTTKLMAELVQVMEERDTLRSKFEVSQGMRHDEHERHAKESAELRELVDDMWAVMSDPYASDEMADACHMNLGCDMDELKARVRNMGIEVDA